MKRILVLGAGQSSPYLIAYLLEQAKTLNWHVTVADRDGDLAARRVGKHPNGRSISLDATNPDKVAAHIEEADVVVNFLAPFFQYQIASTCVRLGRHFVSASYRDKRVEAMHASAVDRGVLLLNEVGLDPGIDHMSAMRMIHAVHGRGGEVTSFISYGSGVSAPDSITNPFKYVITWNARNVVMAGEAGAQYLDQGDIKIVPHSQLFHHTWPVEVDGVGTMEAYPNRDSLTYQTTYGLENVRTMIRGTLRYPEWGETWLQIVRLGLPNETARIPRLAERSYRELTEMFVPRHVAGANLEQRVASYLNISPTGAIIEKMRWLGLFSNEKIGTAGETSTEAMSALLQKKLALQPAARDLVILLHELEVTYPKEKHRRERLTSTLLDYGQPSGFTAMSKTVGLPAALAVKLLLTDKLPMTGSHIPTHPDIYTPILKELEKAGIVFKEKSTPLDA